MVDAGLARVPRYDPASGLTRLATVRASRASADQRRGRAGRLGPGVCYRLWDEAETRALVPFERPEILETDLSRLALDLARWGARGPDALTFLDRPPPAAMAEAGALLQRLGALDAAGALTPHGRAMSELPLPPRLAHMLLKGAEQGAAVRAARIAVLLTERGLGGRGADLSHRLDQLAHDRARRAGDARALADRWARMAPGAGPASAVDDGLLLAEAFPERIAKARGPAGAYQLASGRGVELDPAEALAREPWLAVAELGGGQARDRILLAARLDEAALRAAFADRMTREERLETGGDGRLRAKETLWLGRLAVEERTIADPPPALIAAALADQVRREGLGALGWGGASAGLRARVAFLRGHDDAWPDLDDAALLARLDEWLPPLLAGKAGLKQVSDAALEQALARTDPLGPAAAPRRRGARALDGPDRLDGGDRLRRRGWSAGRHPGAGGVRAECPPDGGRRSDHAGAALAGATAHSVDQGPARLLGRLLGGGAQGHARPLPQAPLARRPRWRPADAPREGKGLGIGRAQRLGSRLSGEAGMRKRLRLWIALVIAALLAAAGVALHAMPELQAELLLKMSPKSFRDAEFLRFTNAAGEEVYLLGTIHGAHLTTPAYSLWNLGAVVEHLHPDMLLVEERPDAVARGHLGDGPVEMPFASLTARADGIVVEGMDWWTMDAGHQVDPPERDAHMFETIRAALPGHRRVLILTGFSHVDAFAPRLVALGWRPAAFETADKERLFGAQDEPQTFPPGMTKAIEQRIADDQALMAGVSDAFWKARLADAIAARRALLATIARTGERAH